MKVASTIPQILEKKNEVQIGAANNAANNNGVNNNSNSNAAVAQSTVTKTDTVQFSQESVALANAAKSDTVVTPQPAVQASQSVPASEPVNAQAAAADQAVSNVAVADPVVSNNAAVPAEAVTSAITFTPVVSSDKAIAAVNKLEEALNADKVKNRTINKAIKSLQKEADKNAVGIDLIASANPLLDQTTVTKGVKANTGVHAAALKDQLVLSSKVQEFTDLVNSAVNVDAGGGTINNALAATNSALEQARADFADGTISKEQLSAALNTALDAGIGSVNSAIKASEDAAIAQDTAGANKVPPGLAKKEEGNTPPGLANKDVENIPPGLENKEEGKAVPPGLEKKVENGQNGENGKIPPGLSKKFLSLVNTIQGILNNLSNNSVNVVNGAQETEKETDPTKRVEDLKQKVSDLKESDFTDFTQRLREIGVGSSSVKKLFGDEGTLNTAGTINRIGDAGDGSGNFNAISFMSSLANGINDGLDIYKEIQKTEKEAKEEEAKEEAVGVLA